MLTKNTISYFSTIITVSLTVSLNASQSPEFSDDHNQLQKLFITAIENSDIRAMQNYYDKGANVNIPFKSPLNQSEKEIYRQMYREHLYDKNPESTPLLCEQYPLASALKVKDPAVFHWLLAHGANPNIKTKNSNSTLLMAAVITGRIDCITEILQNPDVDVNHKDIFGTSAIMMTNHPRIIKLLVNKGGNENEAAK